MNKEILYYLASEDADKVEYWASDLEPLIERNPRLKEVDLIIEGGVGTNRTMVHMMRLAFPQALYFGMDVADSLGRGGPTLNRSISISELEGIISANNHPSIEMERAMVQASCVDFELIRDILQKSGRSFPLLATFKAMNSLTSYRERNPFEKKHSEIEVVTFDKLLSAENPFMAQIHIPLHEELEKAAQEVGWITDHFDIGLLLLRKPGIFIS